MRSRDYRVLARSFEMGLDEPRVGQFNIFLVKKKQSQLIDSH